MWKKLFHDEKNHISENADGLYAKLDYTRLPQHTAIIMDGNGRWAKNRGLLRTAGHSAGVDTLKQVLKVAIDLKLQALTVYAFSTENWKRPHAEVNFLMQLFSDYLKKELDEMNEDNVRLRFLGKIDDLSPALRKQAHEAEELMAENTGLRFNVAMNYGGQDELVRATRKISKALLEGGLSPEDIDAECVERFLDTEGLPPVDLVIRTSGDMRLSNFLLWQTAYAELWFTDTNWPDFTPQLFVEALCDFGRRKRRFGGLSDR